MQDGRFIVIEGPLGSDNTSLAKMLALRLNSKLILEPENPFLDAFFRDMDKHAFQMQIFSYLGRLHQQRDILQVDLFERGVMADYLFGCEQIMAEQHLSRDEFMLYDKLLCTLDARTPVPDLVVFLQSSPEILMERLQRSGLSYAKRVSFDYLAAMTTAYNSYFFSYSLSPLLVVNCEEVDFFSDDRKVDALLQEMTKVQTGTHHFIPHKEQTSWQRLKR